MLLEDGSIGAGAQADEPYMEVFVDSWKGIEVQVPPDMREDIERILGRHGLDEVAHTWPPEVDERAEPPLNVREILVLEDEECPDIDEILFQLREAWGMELDADPEDNLDEAGRRLGRTLWHVVAVVESADEDHPRAGYVLAWLTAAGIGEILTIDFPRPRSREDIMEDPRYYELRNSALDFLYNRFAHDEDEKAD